MSLGIKIAIEWDEQPGDGRLCYNCDSVMVTKMFVMVMFINDTHEESKTKIICEQCKIKIDDSNSNP